jgi:DeoR/GlpR family transcriptional regulator of sugar metabolism
VRRDVAALEQEGSVIVMRGGAVKYKAEDFDEPVVKKKLIHSEEKEIIARTLAETNGNVTVAAQILEITRQALQHKIRKYERVEKSSVPGPVGFV